MIQHLLDKEAVISLSGHEFEPVPNMTFAEQVVRFFNAQGNVVKSAFGNVILDKKGIMNSKSHGIGPKKRAAFAAVRDVLLNGSVIQEFGYHHLNGKRQPTGIIAAPIEIAGEKFICSIIIIGNESGLLRLYVHEVTPVDYIISGGDNGQHDGHLLETLRG